MLPSSLYTLYMIYLYPRVALQPITVHENERIPASLLVKSECCVLNSVANVSCMILSRVLSAGLIWQHDYPGISTFYLIDAVAWLGTIKISKMEFEREMPTNKATRAYYIVTFIIALSRIINPW